MADFWNIGGFYRDAKGMSPFGGFFFADAKSLRGKLVDETGDSEISGAYSPTLLTFDQRYEGRDETVAYSFKPGENGLWMGNYTGATRGGALCTLTPLWNGFDIAPQIDTPRDIARTILEQMMKQGIPIADLRRKKDRVAKKT